MINASLIKEKAAELGFHLIGIAPAVRFPEADLFRQWIAKGFAAEMAYMARHVKKREDPQVLFPQARSVIVGGMSYHSSSSSALSANPLYGKISRYAWGEDYHIILKNALYALLNWIQTHSSTPVEAKVCVDTAPVLERLYGHYAGLGWIGKNTCLINQRYGSWYFLGEILINLDLKYDVPAADRCGTCTRCLDACPTGALVAPRLLDARKCLSYLTIEYQGSISESLRPMFENTVFGCDRCQEVCPWNQQAEAAGHSALLSSKELFPPPLKWLLTLSPETFGQIFKKSPIKRAKWQGVLRNTIIAIGNSGHAKYIPILEKISSQADPVLRSHILWALERLKK